MLTRIQLQRCKEPDFYYTDLDNVRSVITAWAEGYSAEPPASGLADAYPPLDLPRGYRTLKERIQSRTETFVQGGYRLWLMSSWIQIGLNVNGRLIIPDYTVDFLLDSKMLTNHCLACHIVEEIASHVQIAKEVVPEATVWTPEAWIMFPLTSAPEEFKVPF